VVLNFVLLEASHPQSRISAPLKCRCRQSKYKKLPPPTPEGHEGRLFPPEQNQYATATNFDKEKISKSFLEFRAIGRFDESCRALE
jgi:hypothetical protein